MVLNIQIGGHNTGSMLGTGCLSQRDMEGGTDAALHSRYKL